MKESREERLKRVAVKYKKRYEMYAKAIKGKEVIGLIKLKGSKQRIEKWKHRYNVWRREVGCLLDGAFYSTD